MSTLLLQAVRVAGSPQPPPWMPPDGALHGAALDHLMRWNLLAVSICFVAGHIWLIAAMLRKRHETEDPGSSPENQTLQPQDSSRYLRWTLLAALCAMYIWMAVTAQGLWARSRYAGPSPEAMQV